MKYELFLQHGTSLMQPPIVDGVTVEWQQCGQPGKLSFECIKTAELSFTEGDVCRFYVNGELFFYGFVFEKARTGLEDRKIKVTVYDQIYYLTKNKDTYVFEGKTATEIIRMLAEDFHLKLGIITATPLKIDSLVMDNKSLYDMIAEALTLTTQSTGKRYTLYDKAGKLMLSESAEMAVDYLLNENTVSDFDYKTSIAEDTYDRIKLTHEDNSAGVRQVFLAEDPVRTSQWGILQFYEKLDNATGAQTKALSLLRLHDSKSRTLTLKNVLGDCRVRAGSVLPCILGLGDINLSGKLMVEQVGHVFKENEHLMSLRLEQYRPLTDVGRAVTSLSSIAIPKTEPEDSGGSSSGGNARTSRPSNSNKYYVTTGGGGYNRCIPGNAANGRTSSTSVIPNCVGYAYGRYMEYRGITKCNLPTGDAKTWYSTAKSRGFRCSRTPSVGAVAVFGGTQHGHVAFVERINANGDLYLSESNWSHAAFRNVTIYKSNGYNYSSGLHLIGFIA